MEWDYIQCRPHATAGDRHVSHVCDEEPVVEAPPALQADDLPACTAEVVGVVCVDADVDLVVHYSGEARCSRFILTHVLGKA